MFYGSLSYPPTPSEYLVCIPLMSEEEVECDAYQKGLTLQNQGKHDAAICHFLGFISKEHRNSVIYRDVNRCVTAFLESLDHVQGIGKQLFVIMKGVYW